MITTSDWAGSVFAFLTWPHDLIVEAQCLLSGNAIAYGETSTLSWLWEMKTIYHKENNIVNKVLFYMSPYRI